MKFLLFTTLRLLLTAAVLRAADGSELARQITSAKPGAMVTIPAGTFDIGEVTVPPQVSLKGAGYRQTILHGSLLVKDSRQAAISDLTVQNARGTALRVENSTGVTLERLRLLNSSVGLALDGATSTRAENLVIARNQIGVVMTRCDRSAIMNCTVAHNGALSLSVSANRACAAFNNLFVGSQTGVSCGQDNLSLALDHNLYVSLFVGSLSGEPVRESLAAWRDLSGSDRHSVELQVEFADAAAGDFRPTTPLTWAPTRATSSDWGVTELGGFKAPVKDIDGNPRRGEVDLGACEVALGAPRPADGSLTVQSGAGVTSAALFTREGRLVARLFDNLPLRPGRYEFWLPAGTNTISAGAYELRVAESNLKLEYVKLLGSTCPDSSAGSSPPFGVNCVAFDRQDHPLVFQGGAEDYLQARSFEPGLARCRWKLEGTGGAAGATVDDAGTLFFLRGDGTLFAVKAGTGEGVNIAPEGFRQPLPGVFSTNENAVAGMTFFDGQLYAADTSANKLRVTGTKELTFARAFDVPGPRWPAADPERKLIWVISGERLLALDPSTGQVKHEAAPVPQPVGLAVRAGRLAVSSAATKRIHVFDCSNPAQLRPVTAIGREPASMPDIVFHPDALTGGPVALDEQGNVLTIEGSEVRLFGADGKLVAAPVSFWGQNVPMGQLVNPDGRPAWHATGLGGGRTICLDLKERAWKPGYRIPGGQVVCLFHEGGRNFVVTGDNQKELVIHGVEGGDGKPLVDYRLHADPNQWFAHPGGEGDGAALTTPAGQPITALRYAHDGCLIAGGAIVPRRLDERGMIHYDWSKAAPDRSLPTGGQGFYNGDFLENGAWLNLEGGGRGFGGGGTVFMARDPSGAVRWTFPIDYHCTIGAFRSARVLPGVVLGMATEELDTAFADHDGLGLGVRGPGPDFHWEGYWHDQDWSLKTFVGDDGRSYLLLGDYTRHAIHWLEITGADRVRRSRVAVNVDEAKARALAGAPALAPVHMPCPPRPQVLVRKLAQPLPVDGEPKKWRDLGISPQIIVLGAGVKPDDCSAVVRVAWEGENLYFQVIKFDNVITMHQPLNFFYKQDSVEVSLVGGFMGGYKFGVARTTDQGEVIYREQFLMKKELALDPAQAPRAIRVLESASDIDERKLIEACTGADLSQARVQITEFVIPMGYAWDGKPPVEMKSGTGFPLGLFIDDNDTPGLDQQKAYPWPVTFAAFGNPDQCAWAVLE